MAETGRRFTVDLYPDAKSGGIRITKNQKIPWLRIGAESVAIVGSILLAFSIDAWWDQRQERRLESEYLLAIVDEINRNLAAEVGNRTVWERSYSDLLNARTVLRSGSDIKDGSSFVKSLNRGLIYGVPAISTAVFDDLSNSGRMVIIEDLQVRRLVTDLYAQIEAERTRFNRIEEAALANLVSAHTPPGLVRQVGPEVSFDESSVSSEELRESARNLIADESLIGAINIELRRREQERAYLDRHVELLTSARSGLKNTME